MRVLKHIFIMVIVLAFLGLVGAHGSEEITLTTYYPAPYGDYDELTAHKMTIGTTYPVPADDGDLTVEGKVGIGTTNPGAQLEVAGQVKVTGGSPGANKVLTSDSSGLASWVAPAGIPIGGIIMYSGAWNFGGTGLGTGKLLGWALCNGNNDTPNLTDRFVMSAHSSSVLGATGGANSYSLSIAQMPAHSHLFTTAAGCAHNHATVTAANLCSSGTWCIGRTMEEGHRCSLIPVMTNSPGDHSHSGTTNSAGSSSAIDNCPAFLRLAYIMKL